MFSPKSLLITFIKNPEQTCNAGNFENILYGNITAFSTLPVSRYLSESIIIFSNPIPLNDNLFTLPYDNPAVLYPIVFNEGI